MEKNCCSLEDQIRSLLVDMLMQLRDHMSPKEIIEELGDITKTIARDILITELMSATEIIEYGIATKEELVEDYEIDITNCE